MVGGDVRVVEGYIAKQVVVDILLDIRHGVSEIPTDCDYTVETTVDLIDNKLKEVL